MNEDKDIDQFILSCISAFFASRLVKKKMQFTALLKIDKFFRLCLLSSKSLHVLFSAGNTLFSSVGNTLLASWTSLMTVSGHSMHLLANLGLHLPRCFLVLLF